MRNLKYKYLLVILFASISFSYTLPQNNSNNNSPQRNTSRTKISQPIDSSRSHKDCDTTQRQLNNTIQGLKLWEIANQHFSKKDYLRAVYYYDSACRLFRENLDSLRTGICLFGSGVSLVNYGDLFEATNYFRDYLNSYIPHEKDTTDFKILKYIAEIAKRVGDYHFVLDCLSQAESTAIKLNLSTDEINYLKLSKAYTLKKLSKYGESLRLYLSIADFHFNNQNKAFIYSEIGDLYSLFNNYNESYRYISLFNSLYKDTNQNKEIAYNYLIKATEICHSKIIKDLNERLEYDDFLQGINYLDKAYNYFLRTNDNYSLVSCYRIYAVLYSLISNYDNAILYCKKICELEKPYSKEYFYSLNDISYYYALTDSLKLASYYNQQNQKLLSKYIYDAVDSIYVISNAAFIEYKLGNLELAERHYDLCLPLIESVRKNLPDNESSDYASDKSSYVYNNYLDLLFKNKNKNKFLEICEENKARTLIANISQSNANTNFDLDETLLEKKKILAKDLNILKKLSISENNTVPNNLISNKIDSLYALSSILENQLKSSSHKYNFIFGNDAYKISDIQKVLESRHAIIYYKQSNYLLYCILITKEDFNIYYIDSAKIINDELKNYYEKYNKLVNYSSRKAYDLSYNLFRKLIKDPFSNDLKDVSSITIVPDGMLYYLPFELLITNELPSDVNTTSFNGDYSEFPFLVKEFNINYVPSLKMLDLLRQAAETATPKDLICIADPVFASENNFGIRENTTLDTFLFKMRSGDEYKNLSRLPSTGVEADSICSLFDKDKVTSLKREEANEDNLKKEDLSRYKYIHFATHGLVDNKKPQFSKLALSYDLSSEEDGFLEAREIMGLKLNADMVVLSACQTGLGKEVKGEGLVNFARSFFIAGAKNVVVSLWSVNDESTKDLMIEFYKGIQSGKTKTEALRDAKLKLINGKKYSAPYYWAPFVLFGKN